MSARSNCLASSGPPRSTMLQMSSDASIPASLYRSFRARGGGRFGEDQVRLDLLQHRRTYAADVKEVVRLFEGQLSGVFGDVLLAVGHAIAGPLLADQGEGGECRDVGGVGV